MAKMLPLKTKQEEPGLKLSLPRMIQHLKRQDSNDEGWTSTTNGIIRILLSKGGNDPRNIDECRVASDVNGNQPIEKVRD